MIANFLFIMSDKVLRLACGLVVNAMLVVYLSPVELGTWNYVMSLSAIAGAISIFSGLDVVVIRDLAQVVPLERSRIMGSIGVLRLLAGTVAAAGSIVFLVLVDEWQMVHLILIIALSYFTQVFHTLDHFFHSQLVPKYNALVYNVATSVGFIAKVGLMYFGLLKLELLCWILVLESFLIGAGYIFIVANRFPEVAVRNWNIEAAIVRHYAKVGLPLLGSGLVGVFIARMSIFQIDATFDRASVAVFGLFILVFEGVLMLNYAFVSTYFPRIIVQHAAPVAYAKALSKLVRRQAVLWLIVVGSTTVAVLVGRDLLKSLLNPVYQQSLTMILLGLPVTALFVVNFHLLQFLIIPSGNQRHQFARAILGLTIIVIANSVLFRIGSIVAVVGSIALSQLSMLVFTLFVFREEILNLWRERLIG